MESGVGREGAFPVLPAEWGTFTFNWSAKARHYSAVFGSRTNIQVILPIKIKKKNNLFLAGPSAGCLFMAAQCVKLRSYNLLKHHLVFLSLKINAIKENLEIDLVLSLTSIMYMSPCILPWCGKAIKILLYWLNYLLPALLTLFVWKLKGRSWQSWTAQPGSTERQKRGALLICRASGRLHHT